MSVLSTTSNCPSICYVENPKVPDASALENLRNTYPKALIQFLSVEKLYALPQYILDLGSQNEREYNHFPFKDVASDAVRGIWAPTGRVFIAVRYVDESEEKLTIRCDTLFQRYIGNTENWAIAGSSTSYIHRTLGMSTSDFEYLARLITKQPCGQRYVNGYENGTEGSKSFRGNSVVHLGTVQLLQTTSQTKQAEKETV